MEKLLKERKRSLEERARSNVDELCNLQRGFPKEIILYGAEMFYLKRYEELLKEAFVKKSIEKKEKYLFQ